MRERPVVFSVLAVDASSIEEWTAPGSPLRERLSGQLGTLRRLGLPPELVLWQQGEADARRGTRASDYAQRLQTLASILAAAGSRAPIVVARSTRRQAPPSEPIRAAIAALVADDPRFRLGPDTDSLSAPSLRDGCHFSAAGLERAAALWAQNIGEQLVYTAGEPR